jgi:pimeloyl-ACP methyl ester carboxylesterase
MAFRFPAVEPYDIGMLDVGDGHQVYWEACGNSDGRPAIYLHGGPGSGSTPDARRYGRYDVSSPLETAWQLSQNWSTSQLQIIENEGHGGDKFDAAVTDALNQFAAPVTRGL